MVNKKIRSELLLKLKITPQALSQRSKVIKNKYGPMTTEEAVYIIAHKVGINLTKYLPLITIDRIRALIPRDIKQETISQKTSLKRKKTQNQTNITYPLVKKELIKKALKVGDEAYPQVVVLENSLRKLIENILSINNTSWWVTKVPIKIQKSVRRIIEKEKNFPHHDKRGNEPLMYCNFADLKEIICANKHEFQNIIINMQWFETTMDEVYMARNNLAHSIPLSNDDVIRIALFYRDWSRLLVAANIK